MIRKQKLVQAIGEGVIPLLGFFFFDWGLYFILLFYFIDLLSTEVFVHIKAYKISKVGESLPSKKQWFLLGTLSFVFVLCTLFMGHLVMRYIDEDIQFYTEFIAFLSYQEAGIPVAQGYLLLPLVVFGNYQQYKLFFLMPAKYKVLTIPQLFNTRKSALSIALIGSLIALFTAYFTAMPEVVYLLVLIGVKFYIDFKMR